MASINTFRGQFQKFDLEMQCVQVDLLNCLSSDPSLFRFSYPRPHLSADCFGCLLIGTKSRLLTRASQFGLDSDEVTLADARVSVRA